MSGLTFLFLDAVARALVHGEGPCEGRALGARDDAALQPRRAGRAGMCGSLVGRAAQHQDAAVRGRAEGVPRWGVSTQEFTLVIACATQSELSSGFYDRCATQSELSSDLRA